MIFRLVEHPLVQHDLTEIFYFIADYAGDLTALEKTDQIAVAIEKLSTLPFQGTRYDDIHPGLRAVPAGEKAMAVFSIDPSTRTIFLYMISYGGMDWQARVVSRLD